MMRAVGLFVLLIVVATVGIGGCGDGEESGSGPQGRLEAANFDGVESGEFMLAVELRRGKELAVFRFLGPFMELGGKELPQFDLSLESGGIGGPRPPQSFVGVSWLTDQTVIDFEGETYQPDKATFEKLKSRFEELRREEGVGDLMACPKATEEADLPQIVDDPVVEGREKLADGTPVTVIGGDVDVGAAAEALAEIAEDPDCGAQLEAAGVPSPTELEELAPDLEKRVKEAPAKFSIDKNGLLRAASVEIKTSGKTEINVKFELNKVNGVTGLVRPAGDGSWASLLEVLGTDEEFVLESDGDELLTSILEGLSRNLLES